MLLPLPLWQVGEHDVALCFCRVCFLQCTCGSCVPGRQRSALHRGHGECSAGMPRSMCAAV